MEEFFKFPLKQGIGAGAQAAVTLGERVKRGQEIGRMIPDKLSVPIHSSVAGEVTEVTEDYVMILADEDQPKEYEPIPDGLSVQAATRQAGIIGLGGAGFPSYVKMGTQLSKEGYIICNAAECEPVLEHNMYQLLDDPQGLIEAMRIAMDSTGAGKGIIGIKLKHREEIKALTGLLKEQQITDIRVLPLKNVYPVGEERALIRETINKLLDTNQLPVEADAVVFNVETLYAIRDAVLNRKPLIDKWVTIAGELQGLEGESLVKRYPIGKKIGTILEPFGPLKEEVGEVLLGGPYTGRMGSTEDYLTKNLGGIIVTKPFDQINGEGIGIIQCACGPNKGRLEEVAKNLGGEIVGHFTCNNAVENRGAFKCKNPGHCPGQAEKVMALKKAGASHILISHCSDCTNTVMGSAPKLGLEVHHVTDHVMKTIGKDPIRIFDENLL